MLVPIARLAVYAMEERDRGRVKGSWETSPVDKRMLIVHTWTRQHTKTINHLPNIEEEE
jgi:hypothetical protein